MQGALSPIAPSIVACFLIFPCYNYPETLPTGSAGGGTGRCPLIPESGHSQTRRQSTNWQAVVLRCEANVADGSFPDLGAVSRQVRSTPNSGHAATPSMCPFGANRRPSGGIAVEVDDRWHDPGRQVRLFMQARSPENGELVSRTDYAGRVDLHLERRAGLGRANALYLDQG
jgi:hypothetical protein